MSSSDVTFVLEDDEAAMLKQNYNIPTSYIPVFEDDMKANMTWVDLGKVDPSATESIFSKLGNIGATSNVWKHIVGYYVFNNSVFLITSDIIIPYYYYIQGADKMDEVTVLKHIAYSRPFSISTYSAADKEKYTTLFDPDSDNLKAIKDHIATTFKFNEKMNIHITPCVYHDDRYYFGAQTYFNLSTM